MNGDAFKARNSWLRFITYRVTPDDNRHVP